MGFSQVHGATVYLVLGSDTAIWDGMSTTRYHNTYNQSLYTDPSMNAYEVMDPAFRAQYVDSYGQPMKMTWWMMAGNIFRYATNNNFPVNNIMTLYLMKKYHGANAIINGDELSLHYHTFFWSDYDQDGMYFWNQSLTFGESKADFDVTLAQFLLEENVFPVSFRSGWHFMDNEWQHYLNEILPYSMHNAWPVNRVDTEEPLDNTYNWSESPSEFVPFHPSLDNYMVDGDGPGWNVRSVSFGQVAGSSTLMNSIFEAASNGVDQVACIWAHLPESDFPEKMGMMDAAAQTAADLYPDVDFRYCTAIEAMQLWRGTTDVTGPVIDITSGGSEDERTFTITTDEPLFMPQPYVAVKYKDGTFQKIECTQQGDMVWTTEIVPFAGELAKLGIAATDTSGNLATEFIQFLPDDIYLDNESNGYTEILGTWNTTDNAAWGTDARTAETDENNPIQVSWSPEISTPGSYHAFIQVPESNSAPFSLKAVLHSSIGADTLDLQAPLPAHEWIYLGTPLLTTGQSPVVEILSNITSPISGASLTVDACKFSARVRARDLHLSTQAITYGEISLDRTATQHITLSNLGTESLSIIDLVSVNDHVHFDLTLPLEIEPMSDLDVILSLHPTILGPLEDTLRILSNDPMHTGLEVIVTGQVNYPFYVVDNEDPGYSESGEWFTSVAQAWGATSRYSWLDSGAWAAFMLQPLESSYYELFYIVPQTINSTDNALYILKVNDAPLDSVFMDQNMGSGAWVSLGTHFLPADTPVAIEVHDAGNYTAGPVLRADAVKLQMLDPTSIGDDTIQNSSRTFILNQNYPNPFNPTTTISYHIPNAGAVTLTLYDMLGSEILSLVDEVQNPGDHHVLWSGKDGAGQPVSTGVYFCRLVSQGYDHTIKMLCLK